MKEYQVQIKEVPAITVTVDADHFKGVTFTAAPPQKERGMER
jgi:hypothetical protein